MVKPEERLGGQKGRSLTGGLVVVHVDTLQLEVAISVVRAGGINAMLVADHLPELQGTRALAESRRPVRSKAAPPRMGAAGPSPPLHPTPVSKVSGRRVPRAAHGPPPPPPPTSSTSRPGIRR